MFLSCFEDVLFDYMCWKKNEDSYAVFMCYLIQTRTRTEEEVRTLERLHQQQTSSYSSRFDNLTIPFPLRSFPSPVSFFFSYKDYEKRLEVCRAVNIRDTLCRQKRTYLRIRLGEGNHSANVNSRTHAFWALNSRLFFLSLESWNGTRELAVLVFIYSFYLRCLFFSSYYYVYAWIFIGLRRSF